LKLPHSNFIVSFSDPIIFLTLLFFGGEAAIILATLEMAANCYYLKSTGISFKTLTIPFNIFSTSLSTIIAYIAWIFISLLITISQQFISTRDLILSLGILALAQFLASSTFVAVLHSFTHYVSLWQIWKRECFSSSMTQIIGSGMAGIIYKLVTSADLLISVVAFIVFGIAYFYYRQSISEIDKAIKKAEQSEREKAEADWLRAEQAEKNIHELQILLLKEEQINKELRQSKDDLEHSVYHDFLTDLPNRLYLIERLGLLLEIGINISHKYFVMFLDLSRFKHINDNLGHTVGDRVLKLIGKRLVRLLRDEDTVARLGGDEFAIILNNLFSIEEVNDLLNEYTKNLRVRSGFREI
jgi:GGDEF domain-containing protein